MLLVLVKQANEGEMVGFIKSNTFAYLGSVDGEGTAKSQILDLLGIHPSSYTLFLAIIQKDNKEKILSELEKFYDVHTQNGLAFTTKLDGHIGLNTLHQVLIGGKNV
jgi:hypothetical protein